VRYPDFRAVDVEKRPDFSAGLFHDVELQGIELAIEIALTSGDAAFDHAKMGELTRKYVRKREKC
jgi:hypothetical protein